MEAESKYTEMFRKYLRNGLDAGFGPFQTLVLGRGADPAGGYLAPPSMEDHIAQEVFDVSPLRHIATIEEVSTDALIVQEGDEPASDEWDPESATSTRPQRAKRTIPVHELYAQPKATAKFVDDAAVDIDRWLATKSADIFARKESEAFIYGSGVGQPHGILTYAQNRKIEVIPSGLNGKVCYGGIIDILQRLSDVHRENAHFIMNRSTIQSVRLIRDGNGQCLWQPGLSAGAPDTLAGVPVQMVNELPPEIDEALAVAVGDFRAAYQIVDRPGIRILRDPFTDKPFVKFSVTKRVGGDVINPDAIKVMRLVA